MPPTISATRPPAFPSFYGVYDLIDCLMLLGFHIIEREGGCRLHCSRPPQTKNVLVWAVLVAENFDPAAACSFLRFRLSKGNDFLIAQTPDSRAIRPSFEKWYPHGERGFPDFQLSEDQCVFWLVSAISRSGPAYLNSRGMTAAQSIRMAGQFSRITGLWCAAGRSGRGVGITLDREQTEKWLEKRVPRRVWSCLI